MANRPTLINQDGTQLTSSDMEQVCFWNQKDAFGLILKEQDGQAR